MFFCFYLMGRRHMLLYFGQVAGVIHIVLLRAMKAVIASQIFDWLTLILRPRFMLLELSNAP